jgi:hypothetical protein
MQIRLYVYFNISVKTVKNFFTYVLDIISS